MRITLLNLSEDGALNFDKLSHQKLNKMQLN